MMSFNATGRPVNGARILLLGLAYEEHRGCAGIAGCARFPVAGGDGRNSGR